MRLAIVGSRTFYNYNLLIEIVEKRFNKENINAIISGGASGADSLAAKYAKFNKIELVEYLPDWKLYGKRAGFIRNELIVKDCDWLLAFWDGVSEGTKNSLKLAKFYKKPTIVVYFLNIEIHNIF